MTDVCVVCEQDMVEEGSTTCAFCGPRVANNPKFIKAWDLSQRIEKLIETAVEQGNENRVMHLIILMGALCEKHMGLTNPITRVK